MEAGHIVAAVRKEHLLGKRQRLAVEEGSRKKPRIWLSAEEKVAHAWVAACEAGDLRMVNLLLPMVENTALGVNCADGAGMTGLMAALEKGRLEVVDRLLDHRDINMDFTQTDTRGRNALDLAILSPSDHFMDLILDVLEANCIERHQELEKVLLPRLLSCVSLGKNGKFKKMLDFFDVNFKEGALLSFLIISGNVKFIRILAYYCNKKKKEVEFTEQNRRSFLHALEIGWFGVVQPLFSYFPRTFGKQVENILSDPLPILGTAARVKAVKKEIFLMLKEMIVLESPSSQPFKDHVHTFEIGLNCIDVNAQDDDGNTLLMLAVREVQPLYVKVLLKRESLLNSIQENRLEHASILLDCSTYHASPSELAMVRDILVLCKRVLLFHPKEDSADKKMTLLKLLHKVEIKERGQERMRQEST